MITVAQHRWYAKALACARLAPLLPCRRCTGQMLFEQGEPPVLIYRCMACSEERLISPPEEQYQHLRPGDLLRGMGASERRAIIRCFERGESHLRIARLFSRSHQVVAQLHHAWERGQLPPPRGRPPVREVSVA